MRRPAPRTRRALDPTSAGCEASAPWSGGCCAIRCEKLERPQPCAPANAGSVPHWRRPPQSRLAAS
ncbi:hypothetical protein GSH04_21825 [Burkholderia pseudomallei]|nr:hypothetical protein [Burkholderia pseudomallei]MBM5632454.1 hypothetical protein [Burkholderia pseudomallei]MBM5660822.1 hypothetical protein [Burkholderia pseudomallei]